MHDELAEAVPEPLVVLALKSAIMPAFYTLPMLLVVGPSALVLCSIYSHELAHSIPLIVLPAAQVVASIRIDHPAVARLLIVGPVSVVAHSVGPHLRAATVTHRADPLAGVDSLIFDLHFVAALGLLKIERLEELLASCVSVLVRSKLV